jgi:hypothetical protein
MKELILTLIIFFVFDRVIAITVNRNIFPYYNQKSIGYEFDYGLLKRMYDRKLKYDNVFLGSSRTYLQLNPKKFDDVYKNGSTINLAVDGASIEHSALKFSEYLKYSSKPKRLLLEADFYTLAKNKMRYKKDLFIPFVFLSESGHEIYKYNWRRQFIYFFSKTSLFSEIELDLSPAHFINNLRNPLKRMSGIVYNNADFISTDKSYVLTQGAHLKIKDANIKNHIEKFTISEKKIKIYNDIVNLAVSNGIEVYLVTYPWLNFETTLKKNYYNTVMNFYRSVAQKNNLELLDFSKDEIAKNKKLYYNDGHLNIKGANIISQKIAEKLIGKN